MPDQKYDPAMMLWMENLSLRVLAVENILKQPPHLITNDQLKEAREAVRKEIGLPDNPSSDLFARAHDLMSRLKG